MRHHSACDEMSIKTPFESWRARLQLPFSVAAHLSRLPEEGLAGVGFFVVLAPGPVHAYVGKVLSLAGHRVAIAEQELLVWIVLEVVIATEVDHGGRLVLGSGNSFTA